MRAVAIVAALVATATSVPALAGPVLRGGAIGGYDTTAPGQRDDGFVFGAGYRWDVITAELEYAYLDYDGSSGVGGGSQRLGALLQAKLAHLECHAHEAYCAHFDLDLAASRRWVHWEPQATMQDLLPRPIDRAGRELELGISANVGWRLALHYFVFKPDPAPEVVCRGTCPMQVTGDDTGVMLEASFAVGG
ncbi:MAG: hypothetical protein ACM31C_22310 [Acidobacteriota bacterium]